MPEGHPPSEDAARARAVLVALCALLGYFALSTAIYAPESFLRYGFYRRDGNVFACYLPVLALACLPARLSPEHVLRRLLVAFTLLNGALFAEYLLTGDGVFAYQFTDAKRYPYLFLFASHNGAGGLLAVLLVGTAAWWWHERRRLPAAFALVNLVALPATASRSSLLAVAGAVLLVWLWARSRRAWRWAVALLAAAQVALAGWLFWRADPAVYLRPASLGALMQSPVPSAGPWRTRTLLVRTEYLWPRAVAAFVASPLVGTGLGSYDDALPGRPWRWEGLPGLVAWNDNGLRRHTDANAHHSFLHVLAETGLIGLGLLLAYLWALWRYLAALGAGWLRTAMLLAFWVLVLASLTGHRLVTPSQVALFNLVLGLLLARHGAVWGTQPPHRDGAP